MNTNFLTKTMKTQRTWLFSQLENIQNDLVRLSGYVSELFNLPREQLKTLKISSMMKKQDLRLYLGRKKTPGVLPYKKF
jgi:hypothetical protein